MRLNDVRRGVSYARLALQRSAASPVYLVLFVNGRCHAKCVHCFLGSLDETHTSETIGLRPDEVERVARHLGPDIYCVLLAGGEPFMRKDLGDVLLALSTNQTLRAIKVVTNGHFTDRIVSTLRRVTVEAPDKYFGATLSFDGIAELHDRIRGVRGIFERAVSTFRQLRVLAEERENFDVDVSITVSAFNQDHLAPLYDYLRSELGARNIMCTVTRGIPNDPRAKHVEVSNYDALRRWLERDLLTAKLPGAQRFGLPDILSAANVLQRERIATMLERDAFISPCNAGRLSAVIGSDGKVYACETLMECMGDLREVDYDLGRIWQSEASQDLRRKICDTDCHCTYENANLLNVLFEPTYFPQLAFNALRVRVARRHA